MDDAATLSQPYAPVAIYYEDADTVEYIRRDVACVDRRIDGFLTLTLDMDTRKAIGFRLKGFKSFYLEQIKQEDRAHFLELVKVLENVTRSMGKDVFEGERRAAYEEARKIAEEDNAVLKLPEAA
jgi:hypothetical protein